LAKWLRKLLEENPGIHDIPLDPPMSGTDKVATASPAWVNHVDCHPLLGAWSQLEAAAYLKRSLTRQAASDQIRPRYEVLPRIRSVDPDLDALRKFSPSALFEPPPGRVLLVAWLPDLELRCLAETCSMLPSQSKLARLFMFGRDPVLYAAQGLYRRTVRPDGKPTRLEQIRLTDRETYDGFLSTVRSILHAAARGLSHREVRRLLDPRIESVIFDVDINNCYRLVLGTLIPDLGDLLSDSTHESLAEKFQFDGMDGFYMDRDHFAKSDEILRNVLSGRQSKPKLWWDLLQDSCQAPKWKERLATDRGSPELYRDILTTREITGAGRVRGNLLSSRQGPIACLDLVDDVRKAAAYAIVESGHCLIGVVGDEFVLHTPEGERDQEVERLPFRVEAAANCLMNRVPIRCHVLPFEAW
jgi:hypothetical protein